MPRRDEFVALGRLWAERKVPYRRVGSHAHGCNCLGFPIGIAREMGGLEDLVARAEPMSNFSRPPEYRSLLQGLKEFLTPIPYAETIPGDLLLFLIAGEPQHITILSAPGTVLHADARRRRVVEHLLPNDWYPLAAFRIEALDD